MQKSCTVSGYGKPKINFRKREHALSVPTRPCRCGCKPWSEMSKLKQKSVDDRNAKAANLKTAEAKAADIEEAEKFNERVIVLDDSAAAY